MEERQGRNGPAFSLSKFLPRNILGSLSQVRRIPRVGHFFSGAFSAGAASAGLASPGLASSAFFSGSAGLAGSSFLAQPAAAITDIANNRHTNTVISFFISIHLLSVEFPRMHLPGNDSSCLEKIRSNEIPGALSKIVFSHTGTWFRGIFHPFCNYRAHSSIAGIRRAPSYPLPHLLFSRGEFFPMIHPAHRFKIKSSFRGRQGRILFSSGEQRPAGQEQKRGKRKG